MLHLWPSSFGRAKLAKLLSSIPSTALVLLGTLLFAFVLFQSPLLVNLYVPVIYMQIY